MCARARERERGGEGREREGGGRRGRELQLSRRQGCHPLAASGAGHVISPDQSDDELTAKKLSSELRK